MPKIKEELDPSLWTVLEQQAMYDELVILLNIAPPTVDITLLTDAELGAALSAMVEEVNVRPSAVRVVYDEITFEGSVIFREQTP